MSVKPTEELQPQDVLHEPVQGAFETSHSSSHHQQVALDGLIYLSEVGSTLHGVSTDATSDDIDEMGIAIEPPRCVIGFERFDLYEYRTKPVSVRSQAGDIDRTIYSLRKYAHLLASGNPTVLMPMFAPADKLRYVHPLGQVLRENVGHFLSRQTGQRFLGYLNRQRSRYLDPERTDSTHSARPELIEAYGWDCYLDDTEFLTRRGWMLADQVQDGEEIATINQVTGRMEFQHFTERVDKPYTGPMLVGSTQYSQWVVTPNHRMWVQKMSRGANGRNPRAYSVETAGLQHFRRADEVTTLDWYQRVVAEPGQVEFPVSDAYLALVGAYVSEGYVCKRRQDGTASVLRFDQKDGGRLHGTMALVGTEYALRAYRYPDRRPVTTWTLADRDVAQDLDKSCGVGSVNKRLPSWVFDLSGRQADVLLQHLLNGDGTLSPRGWVYYTQSPGLAGDVQALSILAGRRSIMRGPYDPAAMYQISVQERGVTHTSFRGRDVATEQVENRRIVCFTVPNETLVTRRNGKVAMHGNTKTGYHALRLAIQGAELMKHRTITLPMDPDRREFLLNVRNGQFTKDQVVTWLESTFVPLLEHEIEQSTLPEQPEWRYINQLMVQLHQEYWTDHGWV
ncbi:nucleotidyl transferase [Mycobacterium phage Lukilu]|uniref:Nucleotidyltransferase n=1 Tax=Mycobacterium phage Lukilu TaxID=1913044 RepID=A0A1J0M9K1_9CAUD|nr:nucleotidyl transferase [Mycobacterium phage Lukilu]APD17046.1 nucleotidyltransferase [Mycobacterium phage Lukilu]